MVSGSNVCKTLGLARVGNQRINRVIKLIAVHYLGSRLPWNNNFNTFAC